MVKNTVSNCLQFAPVCHMSVCAAAKPEKIGKSDKKAVGFVAFFLLVGKITKFAAKNCRFLTLYKCQKMRYNDKALEKGAWCTAVNHCAEYQAYDTNTGNVFLPAVHFWLRQE
ncbi:MAG: hypothetical protein IJF31_02030 [Clostridia bacterium]|nr:hypothetical protein [Clostridia bacterium]